MELIIFQIISLISFLLFLFPKRFIFLTVFPVVFSIAAITSFWSVSVFLGKDFNSLICFSLMGIPSRIVIDPLSAFFIIVINFTVIIGTLYSYKYLIPYFEKKSGTEIKLHCFSFIWLYISMLFVCMFREAVPFLFAWEIMSISSFFLVIFDSEKKDVIKIGIKYLIQMHIGFALIMSAFIIVWVKTGTVTSFDELSQFFSSSSSLEGFFLFLMFFIGFGIKAGFIPLHTWLPHAHPAAPSHVSGVMSGVMIKMGIYGILRVLLHMHTNLLAVGVFILAISIISGLLGVMYAIFQHDIKKLLAYHSIENIGIIGIGIGSGLIGFATGNNMFAYLAFTGGILHILNHSLFKSLLFFSAGSVYMKTHTKNVEELGGVMKKMPITGSLFLIGAAAICGLPPFNGFISELLIYSGLFGALKNGTFYTDITVLLTVISLSLIGGLAIFCFSKVFGVVFLGSPRSENAKLAEETEISMCIPLLLIVLLIAMIGLYPVFFVEVCGKITALFFHSVPDLSRTFSILNSVSTVSLVFILTFSVLYIIKKLQQRGVNVSEGPTWGCGYTGADPARHQYTATSFAGNLGDFAKTVIPLKRSYKSLEEDEIFPGERNFSTHSSDFFEEQIINKPTKKMISLMEKAAFFQSGKVQHYILYAFVFMIVIFILVLTGVM